MIDFIFDSGILNLASKVLTVTVETEDFIFLLAPHLCPSESPVTTPAAPSKHSTLYLPIIAKP
jgi:hypothetical protein